MRQNAKSVSNFTRIVVIVIEKLVDGAGLEPAASALRTRRSPN